MRYVLYVQRERTRPPVSDQRYRAIFVPPNFPILSHRPIPILGSRLTSDTTSPFPSATCSYSFFPTGGKKRSIEKTKQNKHSRREKEGEVARRSRIEDRTKAGRGCEDASQRPTQHSGGGGPVAYPWTLSLLIVQPTERRAKIMWLRNRYYHTCLYRVA